MKGTKRRRFYVLVYVLILLIFQEIIFRICFPIPVLSNFDRINYLTLASQKNEFRHSRNQTWSWQSALDTNYVFRHEMNQYGFRDEEWNIPKEEGRSRVIFVGDSFVEGVMAEGTETIPIGFKQQDKAQQYEVMNAGMLGSGLEAYLQFMADGVPIFRPDYVFVCVSGNDLTLEAPQVPAFFLAPEYFNKIKPRLLELIQQIMADSPIKFRWDKSSKSYLPTQASKSSPWHKNEQALKDHVTPAIAEHMKKGSYSPFRTNNAYNEERALRQYPKLGETLPFLKYIEKEYETKVVIVYIPGRNQTSNHYYPYDREQCLLLCPDEMDLTTGNYLIHARALSAACVQNNIPFINLTDTIRSIENSGTHVYWNFDDHMKGEGYLLSGRYIYDQWQVLIAP